MSDKSNPVNPIPAEISAALRGYRNARRAAIARRNQLVSLAAPTAQERTALVEAYARGSGVAPTDLQRLRDIATDRVSRLTAAAGNGGGPPATVRPPQDWHPLLRAQDSDEFWWSNTELILPDNNALASSGTLQPFAGEYQDDGLHFTGKLTHDSGSLDTFSFGADVMFSIDWARVPQTSTDTWFSTPFFELFGQIDGWTVPPSFPDGDHWSKCWMHRRQTLLQFLFGPEGPVPQTVGETSDTVSLIFNEGTGFDTVSLPGRQDMPTLTVNNLYPESTIWAHIEIVFEVQIEGNAGLWINPPPNDMVLRTFQWPLLPFLHLPSDPWRHPHPVHL